MGVQTIHNAALLNQDLHRQHIASGHVDARQPHSYARSAPSEGRGPEAGETGHASSNTQLGGASDTDPVDTRTSVDQMIRDAGEGALFEPEDEWESGRVPPGEPDPRSVLLSDDADAGGVPSQRKLNITLDKLFIYPDEKGTYPNSQATRSGESLNFYWSFAVKNYRVEMDAFSTLAELELAALDADATSTA